MPSGAKKRKAAKRRREQEQQQRPGVHPPGSPNSSATRSPVPPQGNGLREEEDDLTSHDGKGSESDSDSASPTAQGNGHHHLEIGPEEQGGARVEVTSKDDRKGSDPSGSPGIKLMDSTVNGAEENSLSPQKMEATTEKIGEEAMGAAVDARKGEIAPLHPVEPVPHPSVELPISEPEVASVEHVRSEKDEDVAVSGEAPSLIELKQSEAVETGHTTNLVEQPVPFPVSAVVVHVIDPPIGGLEVVEGVAVAPSNKNVETLMPLTVATSEQVESSMEDHSNTGSPKIRESSEVVRFAYMEKRTSWLSCCGLFDVIASANR